MKAVSRQTVDVDDSPSLQQTEIARIVPRTSSRGQMILGSPWFPATVPRRSGSVCWPCVYDRDWSGWWNEALPKILVGDDREIQAEYADHPTRESRQGIT